MPVTPATLPAVSALHSRFSDGDFMDCYRIECTMPCREAADVIANFPQWAQVLVKLRNIVVQPFGIKSEGPENVDKIGIFPVEHEDANEVIAGFDDAHLDFRISVLRDGPYLYLSTWVHRHNLLGRAYLAVIMPFHILITRNALSRAASSGQSGA